MTDAFICDAIRTPIGRYGGGLAHVRPDDLAAIVLRNLIERNETLDPSAIDDVILGCANQAGEDNRNVARMAVLLAGLPDCVGGSTVNRLCASGLDAIGSAARAIRAGDADMMIAGGVESMTRAPFVLPKAKSAFSRDNAIYDTTIGWRFVNPAMNVAYGTDPMPATGENVADEFGVSREDQDYFALRSQQRTAKAQADGFHADEIVPVVVDSGKVKVVVDSDEHPRGDTSIADLQKLMPIVRPGGTVTAGNASGVNDGAAAMIVASAAAAQRHGLTPRARILGMASAGVAPRVMGIGPVPAVQTLLARINRKIGDFDAIELNEAFASQSLAVLRCLGLADDAHHVNACGGAIALGHPLGMSGVRIVQTLVHRLEVEGGRYGLATLCVGVGQGLALAVERL
ncbi:3-oxoadipyl-CoA thiolase [Sphingobium boeckii]|uniref:Beta-ketoadipyl-CoA thiolase n=1 Tax=Sphingobium boeckii TaxID=1082345 RepID=A0A7W9AIS2_9SPHN|nr:3-oxoadipyl-CoA thiolase [Sphingobium boeckii]MBB5686338.1 3-oxoadipyl-CoA thiolase [Sphingobium boeckii]